MAACQMEYFLRMLPPSTSHRVTLQITIQSFCNQVIPKTCPLPPLTTPNPPKSSKIIQRGTLLEKISTVGNWYFHLFKWVENYYLARSTGHKCWIRKMNENARCILKIKGMFANVHWRILEDSGRFLARIPRWVRVNEGKVQHWSLPDILINKLSPYLVWSCFTYQSSWEIILSEVLSSERK